MKCIAIRSAGREPSQDYSVRYFDPILGESAIQDAAPLLDEGNSSIAITRHSGIWCVLAMSLKSSRFDFTGTRNIKNTILWKCEGQKSARALAAALLSNLDAGWQFVDEFIKAAPDSLGWRADDGMLGEAAMRFARIADTPSDAPMFESRLERPYTLQEQGRNLEPKQWKELADELIGRALPEEDKVHICATGWPTELALRRLRQECTRLLHKGTSVERKLNDSAETEEQPQEERTGRLHKNRSKISVKKVAAATGTLVAGVIYAFVAGARSQPQIADAGSKKKEFSPKYFAIRSTGREASLDYKLQDFDQKGGEPVIRDVAPLLDENSSSIAVTRHLGTWYVIVMSLNNPMFDHTGPQNNKNTILLKCDDQKSARAFAAALFRNWGDTDSQGWPSFDRILSETAVSFASKEDIIREAPMFESRLEQPYILQQEGKSPESKQWKELADELIGRALPEEDKVHICATGCPTELALRRLRQECTRLLHKGASVKRRLDRPAQG